MKLKYLLIILLAGVVGALLLSGCNTSYRSAPAGTTLPSHFDVNEHNIEAVTTMDVVGDGLKFGTIKEAFLSLTKTMTYRADDGTVIAQAHEKFFSLATEIEVYDGKGNYIGKIREDIGKSWTGIWTTYYVYDAQGTKIAESDKTEVTSADFTLKDMQGNLIATMHRPWLQWADTWSVNVQQPGKISDQLLVIIVGFKTAHDNSSS